jgi:hypothetical protein
MRIERSEERHDDNGPLGSNTRVTTTRAAAEARADVGSLSRDGNADGG